MIAIVDYGAGNLFSVKNALDYLGLQSVITGDAKEIAHASAIILPGVGAFPDAMKKLYSQGLIEVLRREAQNKPFLGICLGMQLLFEEGYEFEPCEGLGLLEGEVRRFIPKPGYKIPHMGWNELEIQHPCALTKQLKNGDSVYFVHSYLAHTKDEYISASCQYSEPVPALVAKGHIFGAQFHPEKSARVGMSILREFAALAGEGKA